jgi:hypothetical protein
MADCLHCEINQLVRERIEGGEGDLTELASMMVESLADLILLAPESEQPTLMAYVLSGLGRRRLERHSLSIMVLSKGRLTTEPQSDRSRMWRSTACP